MVQHVRLTIVLIITCTYFTRDSGQNKAWTAHHKKICKHYNAFIVSAQYQALTAHDQVDALLLTHLVADQNPWRDERPSDTLQDPISTFMDLLKVPRPDEFIPPLCLSKSVQTSETIALASELYSRFGNNNFILHSHLDSYAHGVFPLASRLFNHSCVPSAVCKYIIVPSEPVRMEVIALRDITQGEEVHNPYWNARGWHSLIGNATGHDPIPRPCAPISNAPGSPPRQLRVHLPMPAL